MNVLFPPIPRRRLASWRWLRQIRQSITLFFLLVLFPTLAIAQSGSPFDTGFTALQTVFTGTVAKVPSLIAIVIGGYQFAHGDPGAKRFDHGYAVTSHSSQGLTARRVLAHIDTDSSRSLINNRLAYVSVSRASEDVRIYTNSADSLGKRLASDTGKTAAVDLAKPDLNEQLLRSIPGPNGTSRTTELDREGFAISL